MQERTESSILQNSIRSTWQGAEFYLKLKKEKDSTAKAWKPDFTSIWITVNKTTEVSRNDIQQSKSAYFLLAHYSFTKLKYENLYIQGSDL